MRSITKVTRVGLVTALVSVVWTGSLPLSTTASADSGCPTAAAPPVSGSVYQVSTPAHFQWIKDANVSGSNDQWDYDYVQTANIDMTGCSWSTVIGIATSRFTGSYDGGDFTISNLALSGVTDSNNGVGVFGNVGTAGIVRNTHLRNATLTTTDNNVGLLVGALYGTLQRSSATGSITGNTNVGGLVGGTLGSGSIGLVEDSWASVTVLASDAGGGAGGLVGVVDEESTVRRSYATGAVTASQVLGGLVGAARANSTIEDSYAWGVVTDTNSVVKGGGLVGQSFNTTASISRSYSIGLVTGVGALDYGFLGNGSSTTTANFWNTQTSGQSSSGPGGSEATGKTSAQMTTYATFADAGWSITNGYSTSTTWGICPQFNNGYPFLTAIQSRDVCANSSNATAEFTYRLPDGQECTSISPEPVIVGTVHSLPGREALCQTREGSLVAGWVISVPDGFTGAGSHANPFNPGHKVFVIDSQQFTLVPYEQVLTITYDANVAATHGCTPNDVVHASADGRRQSVWVPRVDFAMARTPSEAPCTPIGHSLSGWNTAGDGSGDTFGMGAELPEAWATNTANDHTLYAVWEASPAAD